MTFEQVLATAKFTQRVISPRRKGLIVIGKPYGAIRYFFDGGIMVEVGTGTRIETNSSERWKTYRADFKSVWVKRGDELLKYFREVPEGDELLKILKQ